MSVVKLEEGMLFAHRNYAEYQKGNKFTIRKFDYYDDNEPIWCAETEKEICPLSEIALEHYIPQVDGVFVNDTDIEYID
jgi:hypothetical protein